MEAQNPNLMLVIASEEARAQNIRVAGGQPPYDGPRWPWWFGPGTGPGSEAAA